MNKLLKKGLTILPFLCLAGCGSQSLEDTSTQVKELPQQLLLEFVDKEHSNIDMINVIEENNSFNYFLDTYSFNGNGVSLGDVNNDGLVDVFFTGNRVHNRLYINLGDFVFVDVSLTAGIDPVKYKRSRTWSSGSTMVDINGDGYLDIYVCRGSKLQPDPEQRRNHLFINNGDTTFTERAAEYALDDPGYGVQAAFFDYDRDGDLDMYLANHGTSYERVEDGDDILDNLHTPDRYSEDRLFNNDGKGSFTDVTSEAGMKQLSFGLGLAIGDLNEDGWPDVYVGNDLVVPDIYYRNNKDGTFTNRINEDFKHTATYSMGSDIMDFNNDGYLDLFVADMTAADNYRQKVMMEPMNPELFWTDLAAGAGYQHMHNALQINNGNGSFADISQLAGVHLTDWSWATLFVDIENDGFKDLLVTNGFLQDVKDKDFMEKAHALAAEAGGNITKMQIDQLLTSTKLPNYLFRNNGDLSFTDVSFEYGLTIASFSCGASYADLDNDGDLDLVICNINEAPFVYRNTSREQGLGNYLRIKLQGPKGNPHGFGAKIRVRSNGMLQYQEMYTTRGYQSSVEPVAHFGLAGAKQASVEVIWLDGSVSKLSKVNANQVLSINIKEAGQASSPKEEYTLFHELTDGPSFTHKERLFDDYKTEILLPHKMSQFGPQITVGDANGDGLEDFYIGGAAGQSGVLFIQKTDGFKVQKGPWSKDASSEDLGACFFDADGDGDMDLYVVSGSNEFGEGVAELNDRLYLNQGSAVYTRAKNALPERLYSGSCVVAADIDGDGDQDLFVGGRQTPQKYPFAGQSAILENEGGRFRDITSKVAPDLVNIGMVTSAVWSDYDMDKDLDLIVVGEWMPITVFENKNGRFENVTAALGLVNETGWWNKIIQGDFDGDGDMDLVAANYGLNSKFKASVEEPLHVYCTDFDGTGSLDIVLGYYNKGICYPVRGKQCSSEQMPNIKEKFPTYASFGKASLVDVYGENLNKALHYEVKNFASVYIENTGTGLSVRELPIEAQYSTVFGLIPADLDRDGNLDLLVAGNFYMPEVETGRNDASIGAYLKGDGQGGFTSVPLAKSGFFAWGDVRDLGLVHLSNGTSMILVGNNNDQLQLFLVLPAPGSDQNLGL